MSRLVSVYLDSHHHDEGEWLPKVPVQSGQSLEIEVANIFCTFNIFSHSSNDLFIFALVRRPSSFPVLSGVLYPNETLLRYGYLGCSPVQPTLAFSIRTLAAYRQSHRTCPRFSIEAQCRMLCHMHNVRQPLLYVLFVLHTQNSGTIQHIPHNSIFCGFRCLSGNMPTS